MITARQSRLRYAIVVCAAVVAAVFVAGSSRAAGLDLHARADAKDVGLPLYPGAVKKTDGDGDAGAVSLGIWGGSFGFRLAVVSYRSADSVEKVAAFYREAMGRYGPVLDCTNAHGKSRDEGSGKADRDRPVTCDNEGVQAGGHLYKVGVQHAQRVFKVAPDGTGASFTLVGIELRGED
ncbi:MAG TPA: hypothetical protein VIN75_10700 [Burkholderiaceae bacterium]